MIEKDWKNRCWKKRYSDSYELLDQKCYIKSLAGLMIWALSFLGLKLFGVIGFICTFFFLLIFLCIAECILGFEIIGDSKYYAE